MSVSRIWIDALTPKQALFTKMLLARASKKVKFLVTTREYSELDQFLGQLGLPHTTIGKHGGGKLLEKAKASAARTLELLSFAAKADVDASLSYLSPEAARASFGLGIKHFVCSDSPHSNAPCRLAVPLSQAVFTPFVIAKRSWSRYGISAGQVKEYHALDPWAWLVGSPYLEKAKKRAGALQKRVIIRLEESLASYFRQGYGVSQLLTQLIRAIRAFGDYEIQLLPRYDEQRKWARKEFGSKCVVPESTLDAALEIAKCDLLIGGGATMTQEAALLGIPNISYFPSAHLDVFYNYYFPKKLSLRATQPQGLVRETQRRLSRIEEEKLEFYARARKETQHFEDPARYVLQHLLAADNTGRK